MQAKKCGSNWPVICDREYQELESVPSQNLALGVVVVVVAWVLAVVGVGLALA